MRQMLRLMVLLLAALVLAACGGDDGSNGGSTGEALATRTARPAATEEDPTATRRAARPSATPDEDEGDDEEIEPGELETITSQEEDFSIGCPDNWKVDIGTRSLQCLHPREEVVIQINTNELPESVPNEELAERTNDELKKAFGENWSAEEGNLEEQGDGSWRIDFEVTPNKEQGTPHLIGRAFVEEHDKIFYLFMVLIEKAKVEEHNDIVEEIIGSYAVEAAN